MTEDNIRIDRRELFDPEVDKALARERSGRERVVADQVPVSPIRRLMLNSMFYMPLAAGLAALLSWYLLDDRIHDPAIVRGEIILVNAEPFELSSHNPTITIGDHEVVLVPSLVKLEKGTAGQPAFESIDALKVGDLVEVACEGGNDHLYATAIRRTTDTSPAPHETATPWWALGLLFPLTSALIALGLLLGEGLTTRNWARMTSRTLLGTFLATVMSIVALIPAGCAMIVANKIILWSLHSGQVITGIQDVSPVSFLSHTACRSVAWGFIGAATGFGMNLVRTTKVQLRNSVIGGALGGALGGLFFDPIGRFFGDVFTSGSTSRLVGLLAVGLSIGVFVALVERLARDAWLRVRTGPLAGKSFILYKTPTVIGNAPQSDVYLYKDAEIDPSHASIHRVGTSYEIEDMGTRMGTSVGGTKIRRRRLVSGDQIVIGNTVLDFEERQKRTSAT